MITTGEDEATEELIGQLGSERYQVAGLALELVDRWLGRKLDCPLDVGAEARTLGGYWLGGRVSAEALELGRQLRAADTVPGLLALHGEAAVCRGAFLAATSVLSDWAQAEEIPLQDLIERYVVGF